MFRRLLLLAILAAMASVSTFAQEVDDTIRIKTRVVFLDALVKDKKTNLPISNLAPENFEVLDDGKPRNITYFTREGQARKPLALILILDLRADGAGRFLNRPEILKAMEDELAKLPAGDEVAIMAIDLFEDEERYWLTDFTNDPAKLTAALAHVPALTGRDEGPRPEGLATMQSQAVANQTDGKPEDIIATETIRGRGGSTVTRATRRDGSVDIKRMDKNGKVKIELTSAYDMAAAVRDAQRKA